MNERIKRKASLAAVVTAVLAAGASAQQVTEPPMGHKTVWEGQVLAPRTAAPVRLTPAEMKAFEAVLSASPEQTVLAKVDYKELGMRRGELSRASDGGLLITLTFPPFEWPHGEGIQSVLTYQLHVDAAGDGTLKARDSIYGRDCGDVAACVPVSTEQGVIHAYDLPRVMAQLKDFWKQAGVQLSGWKDALAAPAGSTQPCARP